MLTVIVDVIIVKTYLNDDKHWPKITIPVSGLLFLLVFSPFKDG